MKTTEIPQSRKFSPVPILLLLTLLSVPSVALTAADIPALSWTERSDWINVKTDVSPAAAGNGSVDDAPAIRAALNAASASGSTQRTVYLPPGNYRIDSTLTWANCRGVTIIGCGRNTVISWYGASGGTMFLSDGATRARYIGISWDGRGIAALGYYLHSTTIYESRCRHEHEKFLNFTSAAIRSYGGTSSGFLACSESFIWNCLFSNCVKGFWNGSDMYNSYDWMIEGCEFLDCGTGVYQNMGKSTVLNCHFERSISQDFYSIGNHPIWLRRCTSVGSRQFYVTSGGTGANGFVIQDCRVASWGVNPAFNFGTNAMAMIFDCEFTNPPDTTPPILVNPWAGNLPTLLHSNNTCPGSSALYSTSGTTQVYSIPDGITDTILPGATFSFLKQSVPAEGTILDVKASPYFAQGNNIADDTGAIQNAINDARTSNSGKVVYIPAGTYKIISSLNVYGGNYTVQGSGYGSTLKWAGSSGGVLMNVTTPQSITIEQLTLDTAPTTAAIRQTSSGSSKVTYDGIYNPYNSNYNLTGRGVELVDLAGGSKVYFPHLDSALTVDDCGRADILGKFMLQGRLIIKGADYPKIGFSGFDLYQGGQATNAAGYWDIDVQDNQDGVIGLWYCEGYYRHLHLDRGLGIYPGRFTMQGFKQHSSVSPEFLRIDNYQGRIMYGPQASLSNLQNNITQTGSNPLDLILAGLVLNYYQDVLPNVAVGASVNRITLSCVNMNASVYPSYRTYMITQQPPGWSNSVAASLDHLRDLGNAELRNNYGLDMRNGARATWLLDQPAWNGTVNEVSDSSGYGYHGTANGGVTTSADAHSGRSGQFDGVDDKITTSYTGTGLKEITVSAWIKRTDGTANYRTIVGSNTHNSIKMWVNSDQLQFAVGSTSSGLAIRDCGYVPVGVWTHVAATWSATKGFAAYINKSLTKTGLTTISSFTWPVMTIGKDIVGTSGWVGYIDDVNIWTSALTPAEIAALP